MNVLLSCVAAVACGPAAATGPAAAVVPVAAVGVASHVAATPAADDRLGGMRLLPGYVHEPRRGRDSVVGRIAKPDGLALHYEIGRLPDPGRPRTGGEFTDNAERVAEADRRWYREQVVGGQPMHLVLTTADDLIATFPERGMSISGRVKNAEELADALLMIMTYPSPPPAAE